MENLGVGHVGWRELGGGMEIMNSRRSEISGCCFYRG